MFQMCDICECYVFKGDFEKHAMEKHPSLTSSHPQSTQATLMTILNNATNSMNTSLAALAPASILAKSAPEPSTKILLLSTSTMNAQAITLHMLKCPWCNANLEHIDVMTGHLMRYYYYNLLLQVERRTGLVSLFDKAARYCAYVEKDRS